MAKQPRALLTVALLAAASLSSLGAALPEPRSIVRASRKPSSNGDARLTTFPAIPRGGVTPADVKLAKKTYIFDGAMVAANLAFVYTWVFKSEQYFSPNFMRDGFCNSPDAVFYSESTRRGTAASSTMSWRPSLSRPSRRPWDSRE